MLSKSDEHKARFDSGAVRADIRLLLFMGGTTMNEPHQARAPTVPRTGRPNREPLDANEVISYALVLAGDLGVSIPKRKRLHRMLKRRIPIPQIYQGADYRLWVDRYYIAVQRLADESVRYVYLTRIHIRSETLADQRIPAAGSRRGEGRSAGRDRRGCCPDRPDGRTDSQRSEAGLRHRRSDQPDE